MHHFFVRGITHLSYFFLAAGMALWEIHNKHPVGALAMIVLCSVTLLAAMEALHSWRHRDRLLVPPFWRTWKAPLVVQMPLYAAIIYVGRYDAHHLQIFGATLTVYWAATFAIWLTARRVVPHRSVFAR